MENNKRIAVVRIKGNINLNRNIKSTLQMLRLYKVNSCVVIPNRPTYVGMLKKVKDFITWGEIDGETFKDLLLKRGKIVGNKNLSADYLKEKLKCTVESFVTDFMNFKKELIDVPGLKPFFKLSPPRKGFERKGTKVPFSMGGVLGYRKEKINDLVKRML